MPGKKEVTTKIDYEAKTVTLTNPFGSVTFQLDFYADISVTRLALRGLQIEATRCKDYQALEDQLTSGVFEKPKRIRASKSDVWLDAIANVFRAIAAKRHAPISAEKSAEMAQQLSPAQLQRYKRDVDVILERQKLTGTAHKSALEAEFDDPTEVEKAA